MHSGDSLYNGPLSTVQSGSATYEGQIRMMDDEIAPYHRARRIVNGGTT